MARADATQAMTRLPWVFDRPWQCREARGPTGRDFPGMMPRLEAVPARNADFTAGRKRLSCYATSSPRATPRSPGAVRARRRGKDAAGAGRRNCLSPTMTWSGGCPRSGPRRSASRSPSLPEEAAADRRQRGGGSRGGARGAAQGYHPPLAVIFDNADNSELLKSWLPSGNGHIIITSRNKEWTKMADPLAVDVFSREESVADLLRHVPYLDPGDANQVAEALGDLPSRDRAGERLA